MRLFPFVQLLFCRDSAGRAAILASAAVDADIGIDDIRRIAGSDRIHGASIGAGAAGDAGVGDLVSHLDRDICVLSHEKCSCGRTHVKMTKPRGRTDDMLIIRGVNVFPSQIETVLLNHGYPANYQIIVDRVRSTDTLDVQVEMTPEMFTDNVGEIERRQKELVDGLRSMLGLAAKVTLVAPKSIVRSEGKAVRIIDKRKI